MYSNQLHQLCLRLLCVLCLGVLGLGQAYAQNSAPYISAALNWTNGKTYFFLSDGTYLRYDNEQGKIDKDYPKRINNKTWPGIGNDAPLITAAFRGPVANKVYFFFANGEYSRFDMANDQVDPGYPKDISDKTWRGMGAYAGQIYGALNWPGNKIQFFLQDGRYVRYDMNEDRVEAGYPKRITRDSWPGLHRYAGKVAGMVNWSNNKAYFFLDDNTYLRYDIKDGEVDEGYPKRINDNTWPGMGKIFNRKSMP
ncbi:MAG: hypothetical protein RLZZ502_1246 [Pseudomonadota bacterium]|jgi:hypothetical protein